MSDAVTSTPVKKGLWRASLATTTSSTSDSFLTDTPLKVSHSLLKRPPACHISFAEDRVDFNFAPPPPLKLNIPSTLKKKNKKRDSHKDHRPSYRINKQQDIVLDLFAQSPQVSPDRLSKQQDIAPDLFPQSPQFSPDRLSKQQDIALDLFPHSPQSLKSPQYPQYPQRPLPPQLSPLPHVSRRISVPPPPVRPGGRGRDFWLVFIAISSASFLEALDFTTISTALPSIIQELKGSDKFTWVGAAYTLAATVFQPLYGAFADIFGRRPCMIAALSLFTIGSALCGGARSMEMLIIGRTVQGTGACGIACLADIIVADLVPLKDRGTFTGIMSAIWAVAAAIGPPIGGVFSQKLSWRWIFFVNIPLSVASLLLVYFFSKLKIPQPEVDVWQKLGQIDWLGNLIVIVGSTLTIVALTWGGIAYSWHSPEVLVTIIVGLFLTGFFFYYEKRWARDPSVPFALLNNRTGLSGYLETFFHGMLATAVIYYLPVYFQVIKGHSPQKAGLDVLELSMIVSVSAILSGVSVSVFNCYRPQSYIGWVLCIAGFALLSLIQPQTSGVKLALLQLPVALGVGMVYGVLMFPILAPLGVSENAHALAFFMFIRTFSYTFGIAIGGSVLQNSLTNNLPASFFALLPPHTDIAFAATDILRTLPADQRQIAIAGFGKSIVMVWTVLTGIAGGGLLSCLLMKEIPMSDELDENYALEGQQKQPDAAINLEGAFPTLATHKKSSSSGTLALLEPRGKTSMASKSPGLERMKKSLSSDSLSSTIFDIK